jgi:hypothetical protein
LNYGSGKGLELIPTEIILGVPSYQVPAEGPAGGGNIPLPKYRLLASNEQHSNYIVTAFLGGSIPAGRFATRCGSITPTIAFGKGYRNFDFQSTLGWRPSRPAAAKPPELQSPTTPHFNTGCLAIVAGA